MNTSATKCSASWRNLCVMWFGGIVIASTAFISYRSAAAPSDQSSVTKPAIAVLDFELHDLTLTPGLAEERERTASIAPMLRNTLETQYGFELIPIDSGAQIGADKGTGYLFEHHDVAAELGRDVSSDWVVVGRVHKASFLFVYFKALVVDTNTQRPIADLTVEVKGTQKRLTEKGVQALAEQIAAAIAKK